MRTIKLFILVPSIISVSLLPSCVAMGPTPTAAEPARITVLYDAFGKNATMTEDWGYAALVEINGKRILFDTGDDPAILAKNVKAKGVDSYRWPSTRPMASCWWWAVRIRALSPSLPKRPRSIRTSISSRADFTWLWPRTPLSQR